MIKELCSAECLNADCPLNSYVVEITVESFMQVDYQDYSGTCGEYESDIEARDYEDEDPEELNFND